jgi:protein-export membrane protein SecD
MRHVLFRIFLISISTILLIFYIIPWWNYGISVPFAGNDYRLGLDLQGGIELDYKIDFTELKNDADFDSTKEKETIEWLKSIIDKRVETLNINDSEINDASYGWENHIIVQIPLKGNSSMENIQNIEKAKEAIWKVVKIQFKEKRDIVTEDDILERKEIALKAYEEISAWELFDVISDKYSLNYEKIFVGSVDNLSDAVENVENIVIWDLSEWVSLVWLQDDTWYLLTTQDEVTKKISFIYISSVPSEWKPAMDENWRILDDRYFVKSSVQFNEAYQPMVELTFNNEGADIFADLTKRLVGQQLAIFVWWELLTAPSINEPIIGGKAVITWRYTPEEAKLLSQNINTWVVPAPIYLTSEKTIDSKIWISSLNKLITAWISWFLLIFVFLFFTYRLAWLMSSLALFIYALLVLAIIKMSGIVLTMASIAWVILSIWMAIDANILIFERVREKLRDGYDILDSTDSWFKESWSAIWDSNFTWLLTALILFIFWINMIKWFGLMLAVWIVLSLFTVMWVSRVFLIWLSLIVKNKKWFVWYKWKGS